ncbi:MAG TPA: nitrilase-related carbon-nitrogen hydrolase, partial [Sphingomicrobium sp.]|nr:nitrilase-related carbon-nitrogen hydrolase [Sphingomicrobium sp.]
MSARIAIFQSRTGIDPSANAEALVGAVDQAADGGAKMLFTPEMSGLLDRDTKRAESKIRAPEEDEVVAACREAARRRGLWVHLGSVAVAAGEGKLANRSFVITPKGEVRATYDKIHLFDVDLPTGESWRESSVYRGGSQA